MTRLRIHPQWIEAYFIKRYNRFVMDLERENRKIQAYLPNTGRMDEFLIPGNTFFLVPQQSGHLRYRVIGTLYQNNHVFLDTMKMNHIFKNLVRSNILAEFSNALSIQSEISFLDSRFDFLIVDYQNQQNLVEVKSCTLCHNQVAMFPDAPTARGRKHLLTLEQAATNGYRVHVYYLVTNYSASTFLPNLHTDPAYGEIFLNCRKINFKVVKLHFTDPVTLAAEKSEEIRIRDIDFRQNSFNKGSYLLLLQNDGDISIKIGALGWRNFPAGYYVYVGSALHSLQARLKRHSRHDKRKHWHIDYITPNPMRILRTWTIRRQDRIEEL
ncbi:MAG: DNA/RNA nuclease SfsA, partial [Candidatus Cloacimonetes bacterium]|nr:DNA/RNA nuclease SfsA [Candidatus Cloacimonadota bacterium]